MKKHAMIALAATILLGAPAAVMAAPSSMSSDNALQCGDSGVANQVTTMGSFDPYVARTASNPLVIQVPDCASTDVRSALASKQASQVTDQIRANPKALQAIQSLGATTADVLGATTNGNTLKIYVDIG